MPSKELRGEAYLRKFIVRDRKTKELTLVLPMTSGAKFVREFLRRWNACSYEDYTKKFMQSVFSYQEFNVKIKTLVEANGLVRVSARSIEEALAMVSPTLLKTQMKKRHARLEPTQKIAGALTVGKASINRD
jgi:hypothetical protein